MPRAKSPAADPLELSVQFGTGRRGVPHAKRMRAWADATYLAHVNFHNSKPNQRRARKQLAPPAQVSLRIVGAAESRKLNRAWRGKDNSTNVLSFPAGDVFTPHGERYSLGDLAICVPVVAREAKQQHKQADAHWAHMVIHGVLHLLGYDHENARDANVMEGCEKKILEQFGFSDPYE
jgi:probable rRNA maturation factor